MILVWSLKTFTPPSYGAVLFPDWGLALGWCMVVFILLWIPVVALYKLMRAEGSPWKVCMFVMIAEEIWWFTTPLLSFSPCLKALHFAQLEIFFREFQELGKERISDFPQRLKSMCSPAEEWHPYLDVHRGERYGRMIHNNEPDVNVISSSWL